MGRGKSTAGSVENGEPGQGSVNHEGGAQFECFGIQFRDSRRSLVGSRGACEQAQGT